MTHTNLDTFHRRYAYQDAAANRRLPTTPKGSLSQSELRRIVADMID